MAPPTEAVDIRALLENGAWLQRLARRLAGDGDEADDAVQETWLAALRSPPSAQRPARPWLLTVLRNALHRRARTESRREGREHRAALGEAGFEASAAEALERVELHRALAEIVLSLEEPYRSTVLLRFFEDRSGAEIARAAGVPEATVRWRTHESLRRLRARLGEKLGPDPREWRGLGLAPALVPAAAAKGGVVVAIASKNAVLAVAVAVAGGIGGVGWWSVGAERSGGSATHRGSATANRPEPAGETPSVSPTGGEQAPVPAVPPRAPRPPLPRFAAAPPAALPPEAPAALTFKAGIVTAMREVARKFNECLSNLPAQHRPERGMIVVRFTVRPEGGTGKVTHATPEQTRGDPSPLVQQCLIHAYAGVTISPAPDKETVVSYPFVLEGKPRAAAPDASAPGQPAPSGPDKAKEAEAPTDKTIPPPLARTLCTDCPAPQVPAGTMPGRSDFAMFKICVDTSGRVSSVKVVKTIKPEVDNEIVKTIRKWTYRPFEVDGRALPFCYMHRQDVE